MMITPFGTAPNGEPVSLIKLDNGVISCELITFGATIRSLTVPDRNGNPVDVVLDMTIWKIISATMAIWVPPLAAAPTVSPVGNSGCMARITLWPRIMATTISTAAYRASPTAAGPSATPTTTL